MLNSAEKTDMHLPSDVYFVVANLSSQLVIINSDHLSCVAPFQTYGKLLAQNCNLFSTPLF